MKRIVCFGDSNVYGYDPRSWMGDRYPEDVRWTGRLKTAGWTIQNEGFNGQEIPTSQWEQDHWCQRLLRFGAPDWALVMLGGNDLLCHPQFTAEDVAQRMEALLRLFLHVTAGGSTQFLLVSPPPMIPGTWTGERRLLRESVRLAPNYQQVAKTLGIEFADAGQWEVDLAFDGVHFLPAGHASFAGNLLAYLENQDQS